MIIGLTSFLSAGKGSVCEFLKIKGYQVYSCSDIIREECNNRGIELTRKNLQDVGNELRTKFGPNILAIRLSEKINKDITKNYVVDSIRTPAEIEELRKLPNFALVFLDADPKIRYERAKIRLREKENVNSFDEFMLSEKRELESKDPNSQQLLKCKELSEYTLSNNGTIDELQVQVDELLVKLQVKFKKKMNWDEYFINIAKDISKKSTCMSMYVGAVITKNNTILSTGYSGAPRGTKDCFEWGYCFRRKNNIKSGTKFELCASVHAEQNAIINAARQGTSIVDGTLYLYGEIAYQAQNKITDIFPCFICKKMIINSGIVRVVCSKADGTFVAFEVKDWISDWKEHSLLEDTVGYGTNYNQNIK